MTTVHIVQRPSPQVCAQTLSICLSDYFYEIHFQILNNLNYCDLLDFWTVEAMSAVELKDQGNRLFGAKQYDDAIQCYTKAIVSLILKQIFIYTEISGLFLLYCCIFNVHFILEMTPSISFHSLSCNTQYTPNKEPLISIN